MKFPYAIAAVCLFNLISSAAELRADWQVLVSSPPVYLASGARFQKVELESADKQQVRVYAILFDETKCRLRVFDNPSLAAGSLEEAMVEHACLAGTNGAYFREGFTPIGLVVSGGRVLNRLEKARLLSGVLEIRKGSIRLIRSHEFRLSKGVVEALQAGPFLLEHGRVVRGLNTIRVARRTVVASDGRGNWALISMTPLTLMQAGEALATRGIFPGWRTWDALNLDGGSSTAFWVNTKPEPFSIHELNTVKNFLGLIEQSSR